MRPRVELFLLCVICSSGWGQTFVDRFASISGREDVETETIHRINEERARRGFQPLIWDRRLRSAARQHTREMIDSGYFSHTSPDPRWPLAEDRVYFAGLTDFVVGENIAVNSVDGDSIARIFVDQWMRSPGHRENILRENFTHVGVGVITTESDTLVGSTRIHRVRNVATQVFSDRDLTLDTLSIRTSAAPVLEVNLELQSERSILVSCGEWSRPFESHNKRARVIFEWPADTECEMQVAYAENEMAQDYVVFKRIPLSSETKLSEWHDAWGDSKFPVLQKEFRWSQRLLVWLEGNMHARSGAENCVAILDEKTIVRLERGAFRLWIPDGRSRIDLGFGSGRQRRIKHRLNVVTGKDGTDAFGRR